MVRSKIAFLQSADENVLAALQLIGGLAGVVGRPFTITEFADENELLQAIVLARLDDETTIELVSRVLLTVSGVPHEERWNSLIASRAAFTAIGLRLPKSAVLTPSEEAAKFLGGVDMNIALSQTPVPLCLMEGAEHIVTFINDGYVELAGRQSREQFLGLPIREALSEFRDQPFFGWLDQVYRTGQPFVGHEVPGRRYSERTKRVEDSYFDFVYHPIRDGSGKIGGILAHATDVTDRVLDKQVREDREKQLYQQWAELDTLYRTSPLGMMLLRASDLTILRLNDIEAALLGDKAENLTGRRIEDLYPNEPFVGEVLRQIVRNKKGSTLESTTMTPAAPGKLRRWTRHLNPIFNTVGEVESIASVSLEATDPPEEVASL